MLKISCDILVQPTTLFHLLTQLSCQSPHLLFERIKAPLVDPTTLRRPISLARSMDRAVERLTKSIQAMNSRNTPTKIRRYT
jgi:hypothetical protein